MFQRGAEFFLGQTFLWKGVSVNFMLHNFLKFLSKIMLNFVAVLNIN